MQKKRREHHVWQKRERELKNKNKIIKFHSRKVYTNMPNATKKKILKKIKEDYYIVEVGFAVRSLAHSLSLSLVLKVVFVFNI